MDTVTNTALFVLCEGFMGHDADWGNLQTK